MGTTDDHSRVPPRERHGSARKMSLRRRGPESEITSTRTAATNLEDHDELDLGVTKLDTSGMYDVHQVKRLLDDVVVPVSI